MANIKSQIKRNRQNAKRRLRNRAYRGAARSAVLHARAAVDTRSAESHEEVLRAISLLDRAAERGVLHRNNAARRKSRLMRRLAGMGAPVKAVQAEHPTAAAGDETAALAGKTAGRRAAPKPAPKKTAKKAATK